MPPNVINGYAEDDTDSPDCTSALGTECVKALVKSSLGGPDNHCQTLKDWSSWPECADTIGYAKQQSLNRNASINTEEWTANENGLDDHDGFYGFSTAAFNGFNTTVYENVANLLQIMMVNSGDGQPQLLCMRANTTQRSVENEAVAVGGGNGLLMGWMLSLLGFWLL
ncbi:hypothetical protein GGR57DRAFT_453290 [Xylariaceae sp. FL1272]|nr:hypothetical protein GGR57DRAFT_453290 [Xylariaceae sp. FL1272]